MEIYIYFSWVFAVFVLILEVLRHGAAPKIDFLTFISTIYLVIFVISPTLVYALDGRTMGQAWTIGGYEGSEEAAGMSLAYADCRDLARAWVLTDPAGARTIPETVLRASGINLSEDHRVAGEWKTAQGASGYPATTQTLWRPDRSAESASEACSVARGEQNGGTDE